MKKDDYLYDIHYHVCGLLKQKSGLTLDVDQNFSALSDARDYKAMLKLGGCEALSIHRVRTAKTKAQTVTRVR